MGPSPARRPPPPPPAGGARRGRRAGVGAQVLADYTSETLDLADPASFRDLARPMGCQDGERAAAFRARFDDWRRDHPPGGDCDAVPPFHYGSFYSTSAHVLHFLVRLEPFTSQHLALQEGRFDVPDRLFHSLAESWADTAGFRNLSDVKELVPELYYAPEALRNAGALPLGTRQDGKAVGDVQLPPWARGSPEEFVRLHRAALESPYVTAHLHEWIDLAPARPPIRTHARTPCAGQARLSAARWRRCLATSSGGLRRRRRPTFSTT